MTLKERIDVLQYLQEHLSEEQEVLNARIHASYTHNPWFTKDQTKKAIEEIQVGYLSKTVLDNIVNKYDIKEASAPKIVAIVADGLIPMAVLQDVINVFISGHKTLVKLSEKDKFLLPYFVETMSAQNEKVREYIRFEERLKGFDAAIVSDQNMSPAIQKYFGKYPNIIRRNHKSIAILDGTESKEDLALLSQNVFRYFGFGARNISKIYIPEDYNFDPLLEAFHVHKEILQHNKYKNNFDYNYTIFILNKDVHIGNTCIILKEDKNLDSRIASLHFEHYSDTQKMETDLLLSIKKIHHIYRNNSFDTLKTIPFNKPVKRDLQDYKDGVDTMEFLLNL